MNIGYLVASFNLKDLVANLPAQGETFAVQEGFTLCSDSLMAITNEPPAGIPAFADGAALLLKVEYDDRDVVSGLPDGKGVVASIASVGHVSFMDPDVQLKYGNIFHPERVQERREIFRRESLIQNEFARKYVVLRAMNKEVNHLFPMDYAYISNGTVLKTMAKKVVAAYEAGDRSMLFSSTEKSLIKTLDHAVTMALSSSEPQHVTMAVVDNKHLYHAVNPGEFFYDGAKPAKVESLIDVSEDGIPTLSVGTPSRQRLPTPGL